MNLAPDCVDRLGSQSPQPNLQEVLFVMGGRSLDDSDDEDDSDEEHERDPRLQRLLLKNCAFYNTKTSTNCCFSFAHIGTSSLFKFRICFTTEHCWEMSFRRTPTTIILADVLEVVKCGADRKTALQECGLDVTNLDHLLRFSIEHFILQSWTKASGSMFFTGC